MYGMNIVHYRAQPRESIFITVIEPATIFVKKKFSEFPWKIEKYYSC